MFKNHSVHVIAMYALLIIASPLLLAQVTSAQSVGCPENYVCTPIKPVTNCPANYVCTPEASTGSTGSAGFTSGSAGFYSPSNTTTFGNGYYYGNGATATPGAATTNNYPPSAPSSLPTAPALPGLPFLGCSVFGSNMTIGSTGPDVSALQTFLTAKGFFSGSISGSFDYQTAAAASRYQAAHGIPATGFVGPITRAAISKDCTPGTTTPPTSQQIAVTYPLAGQTYQAGGTLPVSFTNPMIGRAYNIQLRGKAYSYDLGSAYAGAATDQFKGSFTIPSSVPLSSLTTASASTYNTFNVVIMYAGTDVAYSPGFTIVGSPTVTTGSSPMSVSCIANPSIASVPSLAWYAFVSGGASPYQYSWSVYNDVSSYTSGSTASQVFTANYSSAGTKSAVVRITDASGVSNIATCSGNANTVNQIVPPVTGSQATAPTLGASCTGTASGGSSVTWAMQGSGGTMPYSFSWSAYNDVASYLSGSTQSSWFSANYATAGSKQAVAHIADAAGKTASATCSAVVPTLSATTQTSAFAPAQNTSLPVSTFTVSPTSIVLGQQVNMSAMTSSPSNTLKSMAIDLSTDNVNWQSGGPGTAWYWSNPNGATNPSYTITTPFVPTAAGTYYFRTRGTDANGASNFVYKTLTVTATPTAPAAPAAAPAVTGSASVTPNATSVRSGGTVTLSFTRPSDTVASKLYVSCPAGVSIPLATGSMCSTWQDMGASQSFSFSVVNTSGSNQSIAPNFYVYSSSNPNFANGVSTSVVVSPQ